MSGADSDDVELPDSDEVELPDGPALWRCRNAGCIATKPRTEVVETKRKTIYRCPECKRGLHIDWHDDQTDSGEKKQ